MLSQQDRPVDVVAFGESMALFSANSPGNLTDIDHYSRSLAGADSNVAIGLTRLGLSVDWTSRVGRDAFGQFIIDSLESEGIDCANVETDPSRPTGIQFKSRKTDGSDPDTFYLRSGSAASALNVQSVGEQRIARARHLHITGIPAALSQSACDLSHHAIDAMRASGGTISFDPNLRPMLWPDSPTMCREINALAHKADWVLPGIDEGAILTGSRDPAAISRFFLEGGAKEVAVKLGEKGAWWQNHSSQLQVPGRQVTIVADTVGAGDGFAVGFISARLEGLGPDQALVRGNIIAAQVIGFISDTQGLPDREALQRLLDSTSP